MNIHSLGYRTDLFFPRFDGEVIDRGDYTVIRTPSNPTFHTDPIFFIDRVAWDDRGDDPVYMDEEKASFNLLVNSYMNLPVDFQNLLAEIANGLYDLSRKRPRRKVLSNVAPASNLPPTEP